MYNYTMVQWIAFFYIYCFLGWCFESTYVSIKQRRLVNRGFLRGPMLPLYGSGAIMMLIVSAPFRHNYILTYVSGFIGATALEYVTGYIMEKMFKIKYWDYSNQMLNFHGYICLSSSVTWGFMTIIMNDVLQRIAEQVVLPISLTALTIVVCIITAIFIEDAYVSIKTALDIANALEAMTKVRTELEAMQVQMNLLKAEVRDRSEDRLSGLREHAAVRMAGSAMDTAGSMVGSGLHVATAPVRKLAEIKKELSDRLSEFSAEYTERPEYKKLSDSLAKIKLPTLSGGRIKAALRKNLINSNPYASSKYKEAWDELREKTKGKNN